MVDSIQTMQMRNDQAKTALEYQNDKELRETREKQKIELEKIIDHQQAIKADLEKSFEVTISTIQDAQEKRLNDLHSLQEKQMEEEKMKGETEVEKVRTRYAEQIARYRENADKVLADLQKRTDDSTTNIKRVRERERAKG